MGVYILIIVNGVLSVLKYYIVVFFRIGNADANLLNKRLDKIEVFMDYIRFKL